MVYGRVLAVLAVLGVFGIVGPAAGAAGGSSDEVGDPALTELVRILKNQGVLDEAEYNHLTARAAEQDSKSSWMDRISMWGDFRGRYEGFFYQDEDSDVRDRNRLRYRLRLNAKADINPRVKVLFRIVSGDDDDRSTNQTLGDGPDFDSDPIRIARAYMRISPFAEGLLPNESGTAWFEFGKVGNPYLWKFGKDLMLWDSDITLEGASVLFENDFTDDLNLFANAGYYVVDEIKDKSNPNLLAGQLGGHFQVSEAVSMGSRVTWYRFGSLDEASIARGASQGNIVDGLTGSSSGGSFNVIEGGLYVNAKWIEDWPITLYGNVSSNLDAESSDLFPQAGKEDLAWGVGVEIGDKKKYAKLGIGYWQIQANAFFAQLVDSDLFDGKTNGKGILVSASKQILKNTDFVLETFWERPLQDSLPAYAASVPKSHRVRVRADVKVKF